MWRVNYYPRGSGTAEFVQGEYLALFVELLSNSRNVKAVFEAFVINKAGEPVMVHPSQRKTGVHVFRMCQDSFGWPLFMRQTAAKEYLTDGHITFMCSIMVLEDNSIPVPPSDIRKNLGTLLDSTDGADVSFTVEGETFHAHRAVLAARSEVFKAELLGSMAEATMSSITLHDIAPTTFSAMLRFMYTDALPGNDELGDAPARMFENLLAAADRYALDRLKLLCAQKLWDGVSVDTVADALACAEIYNCPELKNKCIDFVVAEKNFKSVVLTEGFMQLGQNFPSIIDEVRKRVGT
ncbi:hypothetical protein PR202_gb02613 [Eleusine coracana subsp. coracana]|uniref:BTB domain-containing protein n=1 Tax=Eleusine coracana subsp. coracana TaxID=191504 RepID=A0AAV5DZ03_ELECO|nr:hypothetical protein PR202_gb02613 [Eleusine coracana subsp. coracana]